LEVPFPAREEDLDLLAVVARRAPLEEQEVVLALRERRHDDARRRGRVVLREGERVDLELAVSRARQLLDLGIEEAVELGLHFRPRRADDVVELGLRVLRHAERSRRPRERDGGAENSKEQE